MHSFVCSRFFFFAAAGHVVGYFLSNRHCIVLSWSTLDENPRMHYTVYYEEYILLWALMNHLWLAGRGLNKRLG